MLGKFLVCSIAAAKLGAALPWQGPPQTDSAQATGTANWSPAPTSLKREEAPFHELVNRGLYPPTVCGW